MTTATEHASGGVGAAHQSEHRGSWLPTSGMISTRFMELRKRRGLMIALVLVNIGIPTIFLVVRLLAHAIAPKSYGPAGGYDIFSNLTAGVMFVFGFIIAAALGCTAGSVDLSEGMFRHLVVTGRSRVALYLARIPAGLAIVVPLVAIGFTAVCTVCVVAAPKSINYDGASVPAGLSRSAFQSWAGSHPVEVICDLPYSGAIQLNAPCGGPNPAIRGVIVKGGPSGTPVTQGQPTAAQLKSLAERIAQKDYAPYTTIYLSPPEGLMVRAGLWLELEATIGFVVGLGLGSLLGQRTVAVILMIVLEVILTPILSRTTIPHLINLQRAVVGLATSHLEPAGLPRVFGGGGGGPNGVSNAALLVPESRTVAICVILAWLIGWTALGAWRMCTRDA